MIFYRRLMFIFINIFILPFVFLGCLMAEDKANHHHENVVSIKNAGLDMLNKDPVMNFLGQSFVEIVQVLGEPDEQGNSNWNGPHYYILYVHKEGAIRFSSPQHMENKTAVSIILGPGQEFLGARVGMTFTEIQDIMGAPAFGPEYGMDNLYYMGYFFGETTNQMPKVFISFSADDINSSTHDAFIKWEAFEYDIVEMM